MADRKYYVICDVGCKFESMTKEQILTAIMQAVNEGTIRDVDTGFVTTIKTINGNALKFFVGEQSEYEALTDAEKQNLFAIITNDTSKEALENALDELKTNYESLTKGLADGSVEVAKATNATNATSASNISYSKLTQKTVSTDGIESIFFEGGKTYVVTACFPNQGSNVRETMIFSIPKDDGTSIYSTVSRSGYHCFLVMNSPPDLFLYDSSDNKVSATGVEIRKI